MSPSSNLAQEAGQMEIFDSSYLRKCTITLKKGYGDKFLSVEFECVYLLSSGFRIYIIL